jgi:DNA-binding transcriptional LysR family regulator
MSAPIDLGLLSIFVAVAETASFSAAAERLGVAKGTVSRGIARLEEALGTELLHRTTRRVALSTAGTALYERTARHLDSLRKAIGSLPEGDDQPAGELRMTAPPDFGLMVLPEVIARFTERYPAVRVDLQLTLRRVDLVGEGLDLAIRASLDRLADSSLTMRRLTQAEGHAYASPAYLERRGAPRSMGDVEHDWVLYRVPNPRQLGLPDGFRARVVCDDFFFAREALRAGVGVGVLPSYLAAPLVAAGELVRVLPGFRLRAEGFVLLYPSSGQVPRKVVAFRDLLVETLKDRPLATWTSTPAAADPDDATDGEPAAADAA